jgi:hypothetical protein
MSDNVSTGNALALNRECLCTTIDPAAMRRELADVLGNNDLYNSICATRPHLFSATAVFITPDQVNSMRAVIEAVESVIGTSTYRNVALAHASATAAHDPRNPGVFLGYDFHLGAHGPRLIEINTNAGGALLNVYLARAQKACCAEMQGLTTGPVALASLEDEFVTMFRREWRAGNSIPLPGIHPVSGLVSSPRYRRANRVTG